MHDLLTAWAARGFADFAGLSITGSIPIKEELANQFIAQLLASAATSTAAPGQNATAQPLPTQAILQLLKTVELRATPGVITISFEIRA